MASKHLSASASGMSWIPRRPGKPRRLGGRRRAAVSAVWAAMAVPMLAGMALPPGGMATGSSRGPAMPAPKPVPVFAVHGHKAKVPVMTPWQRPPVAWPAPGSATVHIAAGVASAPGKSAAATSEVPGPGSVRAGSLPVWVGPARVIRGRGASGEPSAVTVSMASQQAAAAAGVKGVVFTVGQPTGQVTAGRRVHVSLSYAGFASAYGGDYAARLRLVQLPACALTTPSVPACRTEVSLASADDVRAGELGADVSLPAVGSVTPAVGSGAGARLAAPAPGSAGTGAVIIAAAPSPSGSTGDFTATPLSEAGTWAVAGSSGAFTYSYPIQVPPVPGGLEPSVSLGYDSQAVDGLTSSTNSQASWVGDGWDYSPGFIERNYQSCEQNPAGPTKTGDFCWSSNDTTTLSLNGASTTLVQDSSGAWHPEADSNEKVSYQMTGSSTTNGTHDGDYWVVTTTDGTKYYFGLNQLPGYASGDATTNSAWSIPVFATSSTQPCYNSTFANAYCNQAWRWNLDYVVDPHQDAVAYFYKTETNNYARLNGTTANTSYTQAGALSKIEYGLRAGAVYSTANPAAQVNFTSTETRTDIPSDLTCASGAACSVVSPTFWGKYQLTTIATVALNGSSLGPVDSWALVQTYPSTGDTTTKPSLWLSSVTRTGQDGTAPPLPPVSFAGQPFPNRVETTADQNSGYSLITRFRLTAITSETGGVISVNYLAPGGACTGSGSSMPAPDANTLLCYPDWWTPGANGPILDWFNKYAVHAVSEQDTTGNGTPVVTSYIYPSGAPAWHYNDDSLSRSANRTWDQWRGFSTVTTEMGPSAAPVTKVTDTYLQGMNGDYQSGGGTSSVSVTSSKGDKVTDSDPWAGRGFEHIVYNGPGGGVVSDTITLPWTSAATATQSQPSPLPSLQAFMTGTAETKAYTALASGGNRESDTTYTHDSGGRVTSVSDVPDITDASQDTCTTTTYASNTGAWILDLPAEVQAVSVPCGTAPSLPASAVSDALTFYDNATALGSDTPTAGDVTMTQRATSYSGSSPVYTTQSTATFDEYGRVLASADADNRTTTTAYTPLTGAEPTSKSVTDPMGLVTTTTYDPGRDLPLMVTDPAGYQTVRQYDGLGRLTSVLSPGNFTSNGNYTFAYAVHNNAPSVVTSSTLEMDLNTYLPSETLYDSLGRVRETQSETADGNYTDVTDTIYNAQGWKVLTSDPYYITGKPTATLVAAPGNQVPSETGYVYDGAGRVVQQISYALSNETWETDTAYGGNYATVSYRNLVAGVPQGGTPETTFTDGRGLTSAIYQYHSGVPADPADPSADYDKTAYTYTPARKLATITDAAGNAWSYSYDLMGSQLSQSDPDTGTAASAYDAAGQLMSVTDARGKTVSYAYDGDGRKVGEYDTTGGAAENSGDLLASWTFDTLKKGMLTSSSSFYGGAAFTELVGGYNAFGLPSATETVIPSTPLTGKLAGTYIQVDSYFPRGLLSSYTDSAIGGLGKESYGYTYNNALQPVSLDGGADYAENLSYTPLGQPLEYTLGSASNAWMTDTWDPQTGLLKEQKMVTGTTAVTVDDTSYAYDNVGDVLSESDAPAGGPSQVQCSQYDYLGRLSQAWAQGSGGCASSPSQSAEGGAAPYWDSYAYNAVNGLTSQTATPVSGAATTTTSSYPAAGSPQPHAVASQQVSGAGSGTTGYVYDAAGHATSVAGASQSQSLSWDDAGRLSGVTTTGANAGSVSYLYDASGHLLLQQDPASTTLFLSDEQIVLDTAANTLSWTRFYTIGGVTVAARTSAGQVSYLAGDREGTATAAVDAATLAVTRRYYDPYGNPAGAAPASWPGTRGFVGGSADAATGLVNLGAREYDPAASAFLSPDPLLSPYDPQNLNPYAYAGDSPPTSEDPSGLHLLDPGGGCPSSMPGCKGYNGPGGPTAGAGGSSRACRGAARGFPAPTPPRPSPARSAR